MMMSVMIVGRECGSMYVVITLTHGLLGMHARRFAGVCIRGNAFHRDSRKQLNRQAQRQQHDDEEFAPI